MKPAVSILFFLFILSCNNKGEKRQQDTECITAKQLLEIIADSSLPAFKKMVKDIRYLPPDSSKNDHGGMVYSADESDEETADYITISTSKQNYVNYLHFVTNKKNLYAELKKQFIMEFDFIMIDTDEGMNEYESGHIGLVIMSQKDDIGISYDFLLLRKDNSTMR